MNEEILKLAKECGLRFHYDEFEGLEAFYKAAYNKAIEDAANAAFEFWCRQSDNGEESAATVIRTLEMK